MAEQPTNVSEAARSANPVMYRLERLLGGLERAVVGGPNMVRLYPLVGPAGIHGGCTVLSVSAGITRARGW
jgi:hypothetical protein